MAAYLSISVHAGQWSTIHAVAVSSAGVSMPRDWTHSFWKKRLYCREHGSFTCNCHAQNVPALAFYKAMGGEVIHSDIGHDNRQEDQFTFSFQLSYWIRCNCILGLSSPVPYDNIIIVKKKKQFWQEV